MDFARAEGVAPRAAPSPSIHLASTRPPSQRRTLAPREYLVSSHTLARCEAADIAVPLSLAHPHAPSDVASRLTSVRVGDPVRARGAYPRRWFVGACPRVNTGKEERGNGGATEVYGDWKHGRRKKPRYEKLNRWD